MSGALQLLLLGGIAEGPPITRVYANLPEILAELPEHLGKGSVTSRSASRSGEGTTFEASCYTDPLALDHLAGSLSLLIAYFGNWDVATQLRFTSKFDAVEPLLQFAHRGRENARVDQPGALRPVRRRDEPKFGSVKQVYDAATMRVLRAFFEAGIARALPYARILYWT